MTVCAVPMFFSKIDLSSGFNQIRLSLPIGLALHFKQGLARFPSGYVMLRVRFNVLWTFSSPNVSAMDMSKYISTTFSSIQKELKIIPSIIAKSSLFLEQTKRSKCTFFTREIEFCGFLVGSYGVRTLPDKIAAISNWPTPANVKDVRSFIGLCGFYQRFIPRFANIVAPLTDLLKKDISRRWTETENSAFESLKKAMHENVKLAFQDTSRDFHLHLDASAFAVGATLSQYDEQGRLRLVTCMSRKMDAVQKNYPTHERELLALFPRIETTFLYVISSHSHNSHLGKLAGWLKWNSMTSKSNTYCTIFEEELSWYDDYRENPAWSNIFDGYFINPHQWKDGRYWVNDRIAVPRLRVSEVITQHHDRIESGIKKTYAIISRCFDFPNMLTQIKSHVQACDSCQKMTKTKKWQKMTNGKNAVAYILHPLPIPFRKWQNVINYNCCGFSGFISFTDRKMIHLAPVASSNEDAQKTALHFFREVVRHHRLPRSIVVLETHVFFQPFGRNSLPFAVLKSRVQPATIRKPMAINNSALHSSKFSPFFLNLGYHPSFFPSAVICCFTIFIIIS